MSASTISLITLILIALLVAVLPETQRILIYGLRKPVNSSAIYQQEYLPMGIPHSFVDNVLLDIATRFKVKVTKIHPNDNFFWLLSTFQNVFDSRYNETLMQLIIHRFPDDPSLIDRAEVKDITTVKELIIFLWRLES